MVLRVVRTLQAGEVHAGDAEPLGQRRLREPFIELCPLAPHPQSPRRRGARPEPPRPRRSLCVSSLPLKLPLDGRELPRELGTKPLLKLAVMGFQDPLQPWVALLEEGHRREAEHFRAERGSIK